MITKGEASNVGFGNVGFFVLVFVDYCFLCFLGRGLLSLGDMILGHIVGRDYLCLGKSNQPVGTKC